MSATEERGERLHVDTKRLAPLGHQQEPARTWSALDTGWLGPTSWWRVPAQHWFTGPIHRVDDLTQAS